MKYYGYLCLILACLVSSAFVEGRDLFSSSFFLVAYPAMSIVLVIGTKNEESFLIDVILGMLLIFAVGFMSTDLFARIFREKFSIMSFFRLVIVAALDYCALGFLRSGKELRSIERVKRDVRYQNS